MCYGKKRCVREINLSLVTVEKRRVPLLNCNIRVGGDGPKKMRNNKDKIIV